MNNKIYQKAFLLLIPFIIASCSGNITSSSSVSSSIISSSSSSSSSTSTSTSTSTSSSSTSSSIPVIDKTFSFSSENSPKLVQKANIFTEDIQCGNDKLIVGFQNAIANSDGFISLSSGGYLYNKEKLSGIHEVTINITKGSVKLFYGYSIADANETNVVSGTSINLNSNYNYFKIVALEDSDISSIEFKYNSKGFTDYNYIKAFNSIYEQVDLIEAKIGDTINVDDLKKPDSIYYEDKEVKFLGYNLEESGDILHEYTMTSDYYNFYSTYENVQKFSWDHDWINHTYTSTKKGVRNVTEIESERYGKFSMDFEVNNRTVTAADLVFNLTVGPDSYPYQYSDGSTYYAWHMNPTNGGFQLALCVQDKTYTAGWNVLKSISRTNCSKAWQNYWEAYNNDPTATLKFNMAVEYTPTSIVCYINNTIACSYTGDALNYLNSNLVGMRANYEGVKTSNFKFSKYVSSSNGFNVFEDGTYVSSGANVGTVIPGLNGKYGKFEATATFTTTVNNARTGIMLRAAHDDSKTGWTANSGYYMHHHVTGNVNFTCTSIYDNTYGKHPDGTSGNIGSCTYANAEGYIGTISALEDYYNRNKAFYAGSTDNLTVKYGFEITKTSLKLFIDGVEIYSNTSTTNVTMYDNLSQDGVGIIAGTAGVRFSDLGWTSYED